MGVWNRGQGTGAIRLSPLKSQIPADAPPRPGAPGTLRETWHFAGNCARSGSQARLRRAAPTSPAPAPSSRPPAASARPRSLEPLACPPSRARSFLLFRAFLAAPSPELRLRPPPHPPGSPQGGARAGRGGRGGPGAEPGPVANPCRPPKAKGRWAELRGGRAHSPWSGGGTA